MTGDIIVQPILITRKGQHEFFQLNMARDVTAITGISNSVQLLDNVQANNTAQTGILQLQATGAANNCYTRVILLEPAEALKYDLDFSVYQAGFIYEDALTKDGLAMRGKHGPEKISLQPCNCFYGSYRDLLGLSLNKDVRYKVSILLFTTRRQL